MASIPRTTLRDGIIDVTLHVAYSNRFVPVNVHSPSRSMSSEQELRVIWDILSPSRTVRSMEVVSEDDDVISVRAGHE